MAAPVPRSVLLVDDDELFLDATATILASHGFVVGKAASLREARALDPERFDCAVIDHHLPDGDGLALAASIENARLRVIFVSGAPPLEAALAAVRLGVAAFLLKPLDFDELLSILGPSHAPGDGLLPSMEPQRSVLTAVARSRCPVLITGETGVGKSYLARSIHAMGGAGAFVETNCAALPENLIEAELFGVERGAFTGAEARKGLLEEADGGTLLLDEVGELSLAMQAKLLTFLDNQQVRRVGSTQVKRVDVRIIAATNVDVDADRDARRLRADLLHRLDVARFELRPLRERIEDLEPLVATLLDKLSMRHRTRYVLAPGELERLAAHAWPGNVRELQNTVERATLTGAAGPLRPSEFLRRSAAALAGPPAPPKSGVTLDAVEREHVLRVLEEHGGNRTHAAKQLGMGLSTLRRKLRSWGSTD
ncbi:MAG: sigma-54 dependent transcriptional regulator [Polyangiaceae bacterium]